MGIRQKFINTVIILFFSLSYFSNSNLWCQDSTGTIILRILDINVWSGLDYKGKIKMGEYEPESVRVKRYQALITQIKQLDPDLIGMHEVNKLPEYVKKLKQDLPGYRIFSHLGIGGVRLGPIGLPWNLREGDAILVKEIWQPNFVGRKQLSGGYVGKWASFHFSDATQILAVKILVNHRPVYVFATHWHASVPDSPDIIARAKQLYQKGKVSEKELKEALKKIRKGVNWRLSEAKKTIDFVQETTQGNPFILMGDFNAEVDSKEIILLLKSGMFDVFKLANPHAEDYTWDPRTNLNQLKYYVAAPGNPKNLYEKLERFNRLKRKRIDYIFFGPARFIASGKVTVKASGVVMKQIIQGVHASDHYGIYAELVFHQRTNGTVNN